MDIEIKPCPFCGLSKLEFQVGAFDNYILPMCAYCEGSSGEVRIQTSGEGTPEEWRKDAERRAIEYWNRRA